MKIRLYYIGKPRSREADLPAEEYAKRISRFCRFEMIAAKTEKAIALSPKAFKVVLDPEGQAITSQELADLLEAKSGEIHFSIGGADGFTDSFRAQADRLLSLSKMTLPARARPRRSHRTDLPGVHDSAPSPLSPIAVDPVLRHAMQ